MNQSKGRHAARHRTTTGLRETEYILSAVGFEPTSANTVELESTPLDRSGTLTTKLTLLPQNHTHTEHHTHHHTTGPQRHTQHTQHTQRDHHQHTTPDNSLHTTTRQVALFHSPVGNLIARMPSSLCLSFLVLSNVTLHVESI